MIVRDINVFHVVDNKQNGHFVEAYDIEEALHNFNSYTRLHGMGCSLKSIDDLGPMIRQRKDSNV